MQIFLQYSLHGEETQPRIKLIAILSNAYIPRIPPNVQFELDDAESEWTFGPDHFDFIHIRCMFGAISDWPRLFAQAYT